MGHYVDNARRGKYYVLWGSHPKYASGRAIKISSGTFNECHREADACKHKGWAALEIVPEPPAYLSNTNENGRIG